MANTQTKAAIHTLTVSFKANLPLALILQGFQMRKQELILCKHIPQNTKFNINLKSILSKELAKIELRDIKQDLMAHLLLEIRKLQTSLKLTSMV